ncbi:hypothetical protein CRX72_12650 [Pantoea sp. BRM17]|nr:hypothetical protein CRX72_12650 [Pantoea sp. BRM17]
MTAPVSAGQNIAGLISLEEAQHMMLQPLQPVSGTEQVSLANAAGRITAEAVVSPLDVPSFDNSAMDGYAVRLSDLGA